MDNPLAAYLETRASPETRATIRRLEICTNTAAPTSRTPTQLAPTNVALVHVSIVESDLALHADTSSALSPWTALELCDEGGVNNTWVCHAPESCDCDWNYTTDLLVLEQRGCKAMGSEARVGLYAPSKLAPYVSLPTRRGGSTGYHSGTTINGTSTWIETAIPGCKTTNQA